ncbi:PREDICTED: X-linked retinitis pigmentosa GTPase regulator-like isoform X1 [Acropora digitifera]|uniref:X-linked retinitis pigmentosa GTPase regulator-like isoform X1 n=2 Tax=Acropora digitifera TaxID=70779 RepID=UPI00077A9C70|nr:PREDICTED: X-linked retinitis pigmentosa GTPase regulator-like isoform X1 [Acropora digitifera]
MASDDDDVPDSGAVFTFGKSRFLDDKFWIRDDAVVHLACGDEHSAVVTESGKLYTFGSNDWGQLGHGNTVQLSRPKLVKLLKPDKVKLVAAGRNHTIVSTESRNLFSFGCGSEGQLGHGDCKNSNVPKAIEALSDQLFKMIACGSEFSAVITEQGQLYTWGSSSEGQTSHGDKDCDVPTKVQLRIKAVAVACGYYHMAVVSEDGSLFTCGENESGKLGLDDSKLGDTSHLQKVNINEHVISVACGGNHTAAVTTCGKLFTFGQGDHGQLGHGSLCLECDSPKQVARLETIRVKHVTCGESHTAVITKHGNLYTCGDGRHGKLGMGEESFSNLFKFEKVARFDGFTVQKVACGGCHTLVTAFKHADINSETDSEAEAEKDILAASVSSTKSLNDVVDGPAGFSGSATYPAGGMARNKRRQRNIESLGNSLGGSLPPISKSNLPPLPRALPTLKSETLKEEEKVPVNPLDMSTLPKILKESQGSMKQKDESVTGKDAMKIIENKKQPKDAESSSGISESEEEEEDEEEEEKHNLQEKDKAEKPLSQKDDVLRKDEESEESLTQDESESEDASTKQQGSREAGAASHSSKSKDNEGSNEESVDEEDSEEEEEEQEEEEEGDTAELIGQGRGEKELMKVIGKTRMPRTEEGKGGDQESDDDEDSEEEETDEEDGKLSNKEQQKDKETEDDNDEEEESDEQDDNDVDKEKESKRMVATDETKKQTTPEQNVQSEDKKGKKKKDKKRR